jgi:hypothetical protein
VEQDAARRSAYIDFRKAEMLARHQEERSRLTEALERRWQAETKARAERLLRGFSGIWQRLTGRYAKIRAQNEKEALEALRRDRTEKDSVVLRQIEERQNLQQDIKAQRAASQAELLRLREDVARYMCPDGPDPDHTPSRRRDHYEGGSDGRPRSPRQRRRQGYDPD